MKCIFLAALVAAAVLVVAPPSLAGVRTGGVDDPLDMQSPYAGYPDVLHVDVLYDEAGTVRVSITFAEPESSLYAAAELATQCPGSRRYGRWGSGPTRTAPELALEMDWQDFGDEPWSLGFLFEAIAEPVRAGRVIAPRFAGRNAPDATAEDRLRLESSGVSSVGDNGDSPQRAADSSVHQVVDVAEHTYRFRVTPRSVKPKSPRQRPRPDRPNCDPNYSGACVPPYPPDVDCGGIDGSVRVIGRDPHGLDRDNDGVGCET